MSTGCQFYISTPSPHIYTTCYTIRQSKHMFRHFSVLYLFQTHEFEDTKKGVIKKAAISIINKTKNRKYHTAGSSNREIVFYDLNGLLLEINTSIVIQDGRFRYC